MYAQAQQIAARLTAAGVKAYTDPDKAASNRPCVLVTPPLIDWTTRAATWQLAVLTSHDVGSEAAFRQLDETLADVAAALVDTVERATPTSYYLTKQYPQVACYLAQITTSH